MSPAGLALVAFVIWAICKILNVTSAAKPAQIYGGDKKFVQHVSSHVPDLILPYVPTRLWGFSGHIQSVLYSLIGHIKCPWPTGNRVILNLSDGATLTYDLFVPLDLHPQGDITLAVCPGICNSSESVYIRTFVHFAQRKGYRCTVLNHVGALKDVKVTSPRIFAYGCPKDYAAMVEDVHATYPETSIICIGFSLGGNIVTKYAGDSTFHKTEKILGCVSICQGYDAGTAMDYLLQWSNFRRVYLFMMTERMKRVIMAHQAQVLCDDTKTKFLLSERLIFSAATLPELDEAYTRRVHGFDSVTALYTSSSCITYLNGIRVPMVFINSLDDPIVPEPLLEPVKKFVENHPESMMIVTSHGGHLGFHEGGILYPNPVKWLDRIVVSLADGLVTHSQKKRTA
ncbi:abhydrolase domain-containing protein 2-like [Artemia franciscana]|uniref:AB hydrolase-1 domain-containing protein n=1 Tax=Artemia franciscana TaxID=6661 RepID=A0AA88I905_ARTSF|nr:hypothetical protein QYM36_001319 [Artemia franciscana]